jgi:release factor glutamine methyltransferase
MTLKEVLDKTVTFFKEKKIDTPRLDAEILFSHALNYKNRVDLYLKFDKPMAEDDLNRCRELVKRRATGEPVAYILGKKDFYGYSFDVSPAVLIPRPETELLVEQALQWIEKNKIENPKILDLGCGSGCIGLSLLMKNSNASLVAVDKSADSVSIAQGNADKLGLKDRSKFITADVKELDLTDKFDVILANPPYIAESDPDVSVDVKKFEPAMALFAKTEGFEALKGWSQRANEWLKPKCFMGFEMGYTQGVEMKNHFQSLNTFSEVKVIKDLSSLDRHVIGVRGG